MALLIEYRKGSDLANEVLRPTAARWRLAGQSGPVRRAGAAAARTRPTQ